MKTSKGFTMIELILYAAVSAAMLASVSIILSSLLQIRIKNQSISEVEQQGDVLIRTITQAIRNADTLNDLPVTATSTSLSLTRSMDNFVYSVENDRLTLATNGGEKIPLTNSKIVVTDLVFGNYARPGTKPLVRIEFIISRLNLAGTNEYEARRVFIGSASLR